MSLSTTQTKALGGRQPTIITSRCLVDVQAKGEDGCLKIDETSHNCNWGTLKACHTKLKAQRQFLSAVAARHAQSRHSEGKTPIVGALQAHRTRPCLTKACCGRTAGMLRLT